MAAPDDDPPTSPAPGAPAVPYDLHGRWGAVASALGLHLHAPYAPSGVYDARATFKSLKRRMGPAVDLAAVAPNVWHWMYGRRTPPHAGSQASAAERVEVIVAAQPRDGDPPVFTAVVARIDPPLFVGLEAWRSAFALGGARGKSFDVSSWAPERAKAILAGARGPLDALASVAEASAFLHDSTVTATLARIVADEVELARVLDATTTAAARLARRRREVPKDEAELAQQHEWASFAAFEGLAFDADRMELSGTVAGARVRIALEGEPMCILTWLFVELPGRVGLGLAIKKQVGPAFFNALLGFGSLPSGDPAFDEAFFVRGHPAHDVQRLLWYAPFRAAIDDLGRAAVEFELTDDHLCARYQAPLATEAELRRLVECVGVVVTTLFRGATGAGGPYR